MIPMDSHGGSGKGIKSSIQFRLGFIYPFLENIGKYHFFRQLWVVLGVKLMEIDSNLFSRL